MVTMHRLTFIAMMFLVLVSLFAVSCDISFKEGSAIQKVFEENLEQDLHGEGEGCRHEPSGTYETSDTGHRPICSICNEAYGSIESHRHALGNGGWHAIDSKTHCERCSVCGWAFPDTREPHDMEGGHCAKCGFTPGDDPLRPGFDLNKSYPEPEGRLVSKFNEESNSWKFEFIDTNPKSTASHWRWFLDGVQQISVGTDSKEFSIKNPSKMSHTVYCEFWNDSGMGSCDATITGI